MERILPSYPLFVKDPDFSIWSATENLNDQDVETFSLKYNFTDLGLAPRKADALSC